MSKFTLLKSAIIITLGTIIGYKSVDYIKNRNSPHRYLASMTMSKLAADQFSKTLIDIQIKNVEIAEKENEVSTIKVILQSYKPIPAGLNYSWNLPKEVHSIEGAQSGTLNDLSANQQIVLTLKVTGYSKQKKNFISFTLNGEVEHQLVQREVLLSSRPEDSFEYVVQEYEKAKSQDVKANSKMGKSNYKGPIDIEKVVH